MSVFTRKNALVGFVALKALEKRLNRRKRRRRIAAIGIGVLSLGMLAGIAVLLLRRGGSDEPSDAAESDDEIVGEVVTAAAEPIPAT